jgi:hypothetical protein
MGTTVAGASPPSTEHPSVATTSRGTRLAAAVEHPPTRSAQPRGRYPDDGRGARRIDNASASVGLITDDAVAAVRAALDPEGSRWS